MSHNSSAKDGRVHVVVPLELKRRLTEMAAGQGKKVSALVRESIEEKLARMEQEHIDDKMREAYLDMAEENLNICEEFRYADSENL